MSQLPAATVVHGDLLAPGEDVYILHGWRSFVKHTEGAESLEEAILVARWSLDDNSWMVEEVRNRDGVLVMSRDEIVSRAYALTAQQAYD